MNDFTCLTSSRHQQNYVFQTELSTKAKDETFQLYTV